jgi:hypothetical protein
MKARSGRRQSVYRQRAAEKPLVACRTRKRQPQLMITAAHTSALALSKLASTAPNRNQRRRRGVSRRFRVNDKSRFRLARQHARGSLYTHPAQGRRIRAANDYGASRSSDHRDGSLQQLRSQRHRPERSSAMLSQGLRTLLLLKGAFSRRLASSFQHEN